MRKKANKEQVKPENEQRQERLEQALRENLKKRKQQIRTRQNLEKDKPFD